MNRRSMSAVLAATACLAALTACGGSSDEAVAAATSSSATTTSAAATTSAAPPTTTSPTTAATSTSSGPSRSPRGNIVKQLGEEGGVRNASGGPLAVGFTVDSIQIDPTCDAPSPPEPMNGHFIAVEMTMNIDPSVTDGFFLAAKDFAIVGPNGITDTNVVGYGWECMRNRISERQSQPGKYQGYVVLDASETSGTLIFAPYLFGEKGGWEWSF